jgi:hypothetical protein
MQQMQMQAASKQSNVPNAKRDKTKDTAPVMEEGDVQPVA